MRVHQFMVAGEQKKRYAGKEKEPTMFRKLFLSLSLLLLVAATACNTPPVSKKDVASEAVCQDIVLFLASVQKLQDASQFADATALQAQFDVVRKNFLNLRGAVSDLDAAEKDDFQKAVQNLTDTADSMPEDVSVSDALTQLKDPIKQVVVATENLQTGLKCIVQPQGQDT
jgi:hypothetical protein